MKYLIETDWVVDWFRGRAAIVRRVNELLPEGLGLSVITLAELYVGVYYADDPERRRAELSDFLKTVTVLDIDEEICRLFGQERARLLQAGQEIARFDLLIGVTARHHGLTLLTNNLRHFKRIEGLKIQSLPR